MAFLEFLRKEKKFCHDLSLCAFRCTKTEAKTGTSRRKKETGDSLENTLTDELAGQTYDREKEVQVGTVLGIVPNMGKRNSQRNGRERQNMKDEKREDGRKGEFYSFESNAV